jgi:hypothetical protein
VTVPGFLGPLDRYITALALAALGAFLLVLLLVGWPVTSPATVAVLVVGIAVADRIEFAFRFERETGSFTLVEAGVVIAILLVPPPQAVTAAVLGSLLAALSRRLDLRRGAFNVSQVGIATAAAAALVEAVPTIEPTVGDRSAVTALIGMILYSSISTSAMMGVLRRVGEGHSVETIRKQAVITFGTAVGTTAVGIFFVHLWLDAPALLPFLAGPPRPGGGRRPGGGARGR